MQLELDFSRPPKARRRAVDPVLPRPRLHPGIPGRGHPAILDDDGVAELGRVLEAGLGRRVRIVLPDNRRTMMSARRRRDVVEVRLHHMFLGAPTPVLRALARYLEHGGRDREASGVLDAFIDENRRSITPRRRRRTVLRTRGDHHDLRAIFGDLANRYFRDECEDARITWGRRSGRKRRRSIQLGTYTPEERLIRIHPVLDKDWVPGFYLESVVFHEMLHHAMPATVVGGRHMFHTPQFRERERTYVHYDTAIAWEQRNLTRLLRASD
jgi:hypothetical protein